MPRFHFHIRSRGDTLVDDEGIEMSLEEALAYSLVCARDLICGDVYEGRLDLAQSILLTDPEGHVVREIPFVDAVTVEPLRDEKDAGHGPAIVDWSRLEAPGATCAAVSLPVQPDAPAEGDAHVSRPYH
jgi:hypothetical protein